VATPADLPVLRSTAHPWRRFALFLAIAQCLTLLLLGVMLLDKHRQLLTELTLSRIEVAAGDVQTALGMALQTGLRLEEMANLGFEVFALEGEISHSLTELAKIL